MRIVIPRTVWVFANADSDRMRNLLEETDWDCMETMHPNAPSQCLLKNQRGGVTLHPAKKKKSTHPWITDEQDLVKAKQAAEGTAKEREAAEACSAGIFKQFFEYTNKCSKAAPTPSR